MSHINEINFLGFSNITTPSEIDEGSKSPISLLYPYYNLSHNKAGYIQEYNPNPTAIDTLKHFKLYVGTPQTANSDSEGKKTLVNLDTYDLYHGCDQHKFSPTYWSNTIAGGSSSEWGSPVKGVPVRFQKIHFMAKKWREETDGPNANDLQECYAYVAIADPMALGGYGEHGFQNEDDEMSASAYSWNDNTWIGQGEADNDDYNERLIVGADWKYWDTDSYDCSDVSFSDIYAVCIGDRQNGDYRKYKLNLNEIVNMTLKRLIDILDINNDGYAEIAQSLTLNSSNLALDGLQLYCAGNTIGTRGYHRIVSATDCP